MIQKNQNFQTERSDASCFRSIATAGHQREICENQILRAVADAKSTIRFLLQPSTICKRAVQTLRRKPIEKTFRIYRRSNRGLLQTKIKNQPFLRSNFERVFYFQEQDVFNFFSPFQPASSLC